MMKLSIITINYNNKAGLQRTIDSVICQTWRDFEWIIIDGGSTDGSKELIEQYQNHFSYWCSEPDKGVYNAMNKGIAKAKGEYLNFMNSGDVFHESSTLEKVFHEKLFGDIVYGDWVRIETTKNITKKAPKEASLDFFYETNICHQALFVKALFLKQSGYDESYKIYSDWAKWIEMLFENCSTQYIPVIVCDFDALDGISSKKDLNSQMILEKRRLRNSIPIPVRSVIERLREYDSAPLSREVLYYSKRNSFSYKLIRANMIFVKLINCFSGSKL